MAVAVDDTEVSLDEVESVVLPDESPEDELAAEAESPIRSRSALLRALALGLTMTVVVGGLVGWLGYQVNRSQTVAQTQARFLQAGRQAAVNLTTIDFVSVDADIQRVLDSAIGDFHDDFQQRSNAFADVVRQVQSKSEGTIAEAGIESVADGSARVLVAASVRTSNAGVPEGQARHWRMRITLEQVGDEIKVSNVEFVP